MMGHLPSLNHLNTETLTTITSKLLDKDIAFIGICVGAGFLIVYLFILYLFNKWNVS